MNLLTTLSASQTSTWHVNFRFLNTYESILNFNNCQRKACRAACRWAERAASTRRVAHFRPLGVGAVQKGLCLISCIQFNTATPKPVWFWRVGGLDGVHIAIEVATCNIVVYPGELPWGSARTCRLAPLHVRAPLPAHVGTQQGVQSAIKRTAILVNRHGAQHAQVVRPPFTFGRILWPGFEFSPRAQAGPRAAVVDDEGVSLPGELFRLSTLSSSFQIYATRPVAAISPPMSRLTCQFPPPLHHVVHAGSRNEVFAGHGAACWESTV